jgi:hypothetical protein
MWQSENMSEETVTEFTFFVDAEQFGLGGYESAALAADESDLHEAGVYNVDIPRGFGTDLGDRIPVRVTGTARGLKFYARLLSLKDPLQLEELERVRAAALTRDDQ